MRTATDFTRSMSTPWKASGRCCAPGYLRPHRGLSQEKLPLYLGFFPFMHNARIRGKGLLKPLLDVLLA
jgi:hypothetical protein